jgi:hypothetical protein
MSVLRRTVGGLVTVLTLVAAVIGLGAGAASAHNLGRAVVFVRALTLAPIGDDWRATATVADLDSGAPLQNTSVVALTGRPVQRTALTPTSMAGQYQGTVRNARPGPIQLELQVRSIPGAAAVQPYDKVWSTSLVAGETNEVVVDDGDRSGNDLPLIIAVAAAVLIGAMLYGLFSVRHRTPAPVPAK